MSTNCLFCDFARHKETCFQVWEDEHFMAFLTPYPNTKGFTVVIPKEH
nr:HIT family protein [Silvanigrella aquatica]